MVETAVYEAREVQHHPYPGYHEQLQKTHGISDFTRFITLQWQSLLGVLQYPFFPPSIIIKFYMGTWLLS